MFWRNSTILLMFASEPIAFSSCWGLLSPRWRSRCSASSLHSTKMWLIVSMLLLQKGQIGGGPDSIRWPWVSLVWPARIRFNTTSSLLFSFGGLGNGEMTSLIDLSLLFLRFLHAFALASYSFLPIVG